MIDFYQQKISMVLVPIRKYIFLTATMRILKIKNYFIFFFYNEISWFVVLKKNSTGLLSVFYQKFTFLILFDDLYSQIKINIFSTNTRVFFYFWITLLGSRERSTLPAVVLIILASTCHRDQYYRYHFGEGISHDTGRNQYY